MEHGSSSSSLGTRHGPLSPATSAQYVAACKAGDAGFVRQLMNSGIDLDNKLPVGFLMACKLGHAGVVNAILAPSAAREKLLGHLDLAFVTACKHGSAAVLEELFAAEGPNAVINTHAINGYAFRSACERNHATVLQVLLRLEGQQRIDVLQNGERGMLKACTNSSPTTARLLLDLDGDRLSSIPLERLPIQAAEERWRTAATVLDAAAGCKHWHQRAHALAKTLAMLCRVDTTTSIDYKDTCLSLLGALREGEGRADCSMVTLQGLVQRVWGSGCRGRRLRADECDEVTATLWHTSAQMLLQQCGASAAVVRQQTVYRVWQSLQWGGRCALVTSRAAFRGRRHRG